MGNQPRWENAITKCWNRAATINESIIYWQLEIVIRAFCFVVYTSDRSCKIHNGNMQLQQSLIQVLTKPGVTDCALAGTGAAITRICCSFSMVQKPGGCQSVYWGTLFLTKHTRVSPCSNSTLGSSSMRPQSTSFFMTLTSSFRCFIDCNLPVNIQIIYSGHRTEQSDEKV